MQTYTIEKMLRDHEAVQGRLIKPSMLYFCFFLGSLLYLLSASGCGGKQSGSITISYNCPANLNEVKALEEEKKDFLKQTGIEMKIIPFSGDDKLYAMMAGGQAPDVFYTNAVVRDRFAAEGHVLDLRQFIRSDSFLTRLWPSLYESSLSLDSGLYSVPNWVYTCGVYYNRKVFRDAGIPTPDSTWTWEDMKRIARRLTEDSDGDGRPDRYGIHIASHLLEIFETMNHAPIKRNGLYLHFSQETQEVYRDYRALLDEGIMPDPRRVQAMGMHAHQLLESGKVAMLVEAVPNTDLFRMLSIDWGLLPLPRFGSKPPRYFRSASGGLSISAHTPNPEAAWKTLRWIIADAPTYQPNPVLRDVDFTSGWFVRYPVLKENGFAQVWRLAEQYPGPDDRYFVRFSSWTMNPVMELLQPKLDQFFARQLSLEALVASAAGMNTRVKKEVEDILSRKTLKPSFLANLRRQYGAERLTE